MKIRGFEIQAQLQAVLDSIAEREFDRCFQLLGEETLGRYINSEGGYFEENNADLQLI
jgi:hypothetical protein